MKSAGAGVYDNRLRYALLRVVGVFSGCIFIAAGLIALFDSRGSWVTVAFFVFFGVVLTAIPLLFRSGKVPPDTRIIDGTYGTFLPVRTTSAARLFVFIALALLFSALALGGLVRAFSGSVRSNFWLALLVSLGLGTLLLSPLAEPSTRGNGKMSAFFLPLLMFPVRPISARRADLARNFRDLPTLDEIGPNSAAGQELAHI